MPLNNLDPAPKSVDTSLGDHRCPKCGVEMEPIETAADAPPFQQLELCPGCYLVMWNDHDGIHVRQGVPMSQDARHTAPTWGSGEPEEC
jgi:uncharacterized protein with PIN domain